LVSGLDAADKTAEARRVGEEASTRYQRAVDQFDTARERTTAYLATYGALRLDIFDDELRRLQSALDRIVGANLEPLAELDFELAAQVRELGLSEVDFAGVDAARALAASAGAGGATYLAAIGAVGAFGVASTGTPIAVLSGAAAANATVAWFGGGALAAGGLGAGAGAAILGGVVVGPALAVGGFVLNARASRRLEEAKAYAAKVAVHTEELRTARLAAQLIGRRASAFTDIATDLRALLTPLVIWAEQTATNARTPDELSEMEIRRLHLTVELARTLKKLLDTPLVTDDGKASPASAAAIKATRADIKARA
jgi:hypothetical protein